VSVDYGRGEYVRLMADRDIAIRRLVEKGYVFVTNAFRPGAAPKGVRAKDVEAFRVRLRQEGYQVEVASAYNETGDVLPSMVSVWRRPGTGPSRPSVCEWG
jgi:DNA-binding beta-propeller fold protein YncE